MHQAHARLGALQRGQQCIERRALLVRGGDGLGDGARLVGLADDGLVHVLGRGPVRFAQTHEPRAREALERLPAGFAEHGADEAEAHGPRFEQAVQQTDLMHGIGPHGEGRIAAQAGVEFLVAPALAQAHAHPPRRPDPGEQRQPLRRQRRQRLGAQRAWKVEAVHVETYLGRTKPARQNELQHAAGPHHVPSGKVAHQLQGGGVENGGLLQRPEQRLEGHALGRGGAGSLQNPGAKATTQRDQRPQPGDGLGQPVRPEIRKRGVGRTGQPDLPGLPGVSHATFSRPSSPRRGLFAAAGHEFLNAPHEVVVQVLVVQGEVDVGGEVLHPVAGVETLAVQLHGEQPPTAGQPLQGVGKLQLAAHAGRQLLQILEDLRSEHGA